MLHLRNLYKLFYLIEWKNTDNAVLFEFIKQISEVLLKKFVELITLLIYQTEPYYVLKYYYVVFYAKSKTELCLYVMKQVYQRLVWRVKHCIF